MATQGLLTITKNGATHIKVVVGSDGYNIDKLADLIKERNLWDKPQEIWDVCDDAGVGSMRGGRIVQYGSEGKSFITEDGPNHFACDNVDHYCCEPWMNLYTKKWAIPEFNPRWEYGTAPYVKVIEAP